LQAVDYHIDHEELIGIRLNPSDGVFQEGSPPLGSVIPPLAVSGLLVSKAALLEALRLYIPQLIDLVLVEGGRFLLTLEPITATDIAETDGENPND
jgi:hypothetical protein